MSTNKIAAHPTIPGHDILVCVFQRGAADGLNALVPYTDPYYLATHRPTIGVPVPGNPGGGIAITPEYALNPALALLEPIYLAGDLALVHATGVPHQIRSHFSAQNLIERGVVEKTGPDTGWPGTKKSIEGCRPRGHFFDEIKVAVVEDTGEPATSGVLHVLSVHFPASKD